MEHDLWEMTTGLPSSPHEVFAIKDNVDGVKVHTFDYTDGEFLELTCISHGQDVIPWCV